MKTVQNFKTKRSLARIDILSPILNNYKGGYIVRKIMDDPMYGQYSYILTCDFRLIPQIMLQYYLNWPSRTYEGSNRAALLTNKEPTPLCANYEHPNKEDAIKKHQSRFSM